MNSIEEIKQYIEDITGEKVVLFFNHDYASAFIGISDDFRAIYDYNKMIDYVMKKEGIEELDATEWINYNTIRAMAYMGEKCPIILYPI